MSGFFPFHPRRLRRALLAGALGGLALTAWALWGVAGRTEAFGEARAGISLGLALTFLYARFRLRPRPGWGLTVAPEGVRLSRPFSGVPLELPWTEVAEVRRLGPRRDAVALLLTGGRRLLLPRILFDEPRHFEAAVQALTEMTRRVETTSKPTGFIQ